MNIALQPNERVILSSKVGLSNGQPGALFPDLARGDLILTNARLIFEAEKPDEAQRQIISLTNIRSGTSSWIRLAAGVQD